MEQLAALPEGEHVTTQDGSGLSQWTKCGPGVWRSSNGYQVAERHFRGAVEAGQVRTGINYTAGGVYREARPRIHNYIYVLLTPNPGEGAGNGTWWVVQFESTTTQPNGPARFVQILTTRPADAQLVPLDAENPPWAQMVYAMGMTWVSLRRERDTLSRSIVETQRGQRSAQEQVLRLQRQLAETQQQLAETHTRPMPTLQSEVDAAVTRERRRIQDMLHEWAKDADMAEDGTFNAVLEALNMARVDRETVQVEVTAYISCNQEVDAENIAGLIQRPEGVPVEVSAETVTAAVPLTVSLKTTKEVTYGDCGCQDISRNEVVELLRSAGIQFEDLDDYEAECSNC